MSGALLTFEWPPIDGGISRLCNEIFNNSKAGGLDLEIITQSGPAASLQQSRPLREISTAAELRRRNIDYLISGIWYPEGFIAQMTVSCPKVVLAHGLELLPKKQFAKELIWKQMRHHTLRSADLVIANSSYTKNLVSRSCPSANVIAIPLGVDEKKFQPLEKVSTGATQFQLLTIARIVRYKGFEIVFKAIQQLPMETRKNIVYNIGGRGPDRKFLEDLSHQMGISENINWLGFIQEADLIKIYNQSDLYVMMTQENDAEVEGFGLSFLEAQSCGTPVIGSHTGGIPDAIDDGNGGWLLEPSDYVYLAKHIQRLAMNSHLLASAGRAARKRVVQNATWSHYVKTFASCLREAGVIGVSN